VEIKLIELNIPYEREKQIKVSFNSENLGEFFVDFVIDRKVIVELKKVWRITQDEVKQALRYLDALNLRLGIIANFKHKRLEYRRILN